MKKINFLTDKKYYVLLLIGLSIYVLFSLYNFRESTDISLYPIKSLNKQYTSQRTWLISYASGNTYIQNQNNLNMSASIHQAFDVVISYQPQHIDLEYFAKHRKILTQKRGVGYWLWKPYIILKTLEMMPENDILFYIDRSGIFRSGIHQVLDIAKQHDITLFPNSHTNREYMKKAVIEKILSGDDSLRDKVQLEGGFVLLRNTKKTRAFIEQWLKYSEDPELLTDMQSATGEYEDLKDHRHDQAILTALYYKNPNEYNLYTPYPARLDAFCVTKRHNKKYSLASLTFEKYFSKYNPVRWLNGRQYEQCM